MVLTFGRITQNLLTPQQNCSLQDQKELLRGLKWGIVCLCSLKIARYMARNFNVSILQFGHFLSFSKENSSIFTESGFCQKYFLMFLSISRAIFEVQRRTIPHFYPLNNSFWPYEEQFCCRVNRFWVIRPNVSTIFY